MKTPLNQHTRTVGQNLRGKRHIVGATSEMDEPPFSVELVVKADHSFCNVLLEAVDNADTAANKKRTANG